MACAVDASSPIRYTGVIATGATITSAAFTAPANSLLVAMSQTDGTSGQTPSVVFSDTGGGLTWIKRVERTASETTAGGLSVIYTAEQVSSISRQVVATFTQGSGSTLRISAKVYVVTGADIGGTPVDTVGANNEGGSGTNNLTTTSITPGATGLLMVSDCDWNQQGVFDASSDLTEDSADYSGQISVDSGYKACTSGVGVTANLNAGGAGTPQHKWCQIVVRQAATAGDAQEWLSRAPMRQTRSVNVSY